MPSTLCQNELKYSGCRGLGDTRLYTFGKVDCLITFKNFSKIVNLIILPDNVLPIPLLLGRTFLNFKIGLTFCQPQTPQMKTTVNYCKTQEDTFSETLNSINTRSYICAFDQIYQPPFMHFSNPSTSEFVPKSKTNIKAFNELSENNILA